MSAKNFMSYGDAETVFTAIANAIKNNEDAVAAVTSALAAIKDGTDIDSFGDVEVALLDKADTSDLGTAAAKDSTNSVTSGSTDLVESGAVREAIDTAVAAAYHHAGTKTVAQLTHDLLIAANEGNVYNITDSGTTTSDFIEGIGKQIDAGDNVGICKVGNVYMFDLLSGLEDTSGFVRKSQTSGLLKNDGTVNTTIEDTVAGHTTAIAGKVDKVDGKGLSTNDFTNTYKDKVDNNAGAIEAIVNEYGAKNLLLNKATTKTINGVTFTVNSDGSITANGTVTGTYASLQFCSMELKKGRYKLSGCPSGFSGNISIHCDTINVDDTGDSNEFELLSDSTGFNVKFNAGVGVTFDNTVIKPMIRDARIADPTYVPYAMTNRELTGSIDQLKSGLITPSAGYAKLGSGAIDSANPVVVSLGNNNISDYDVLYFCVSYYDSGVATYGSLTIPTILVRQLYNSDAGVTFLARNATYDDTVGVGVVLNTNDNTIRFAPSAQPAGVYYVVYGVKWRTSN